MRLTNMGCEMVDLLNDETKELQQHYNERVATLGNALYNAQDTFDLSNPFEVAKAVVDLGYMKLPYGEVIIPKQEYEELKKCAYNSERVLRWLTAFDEKATELIKDFAEKVKSALEEYRLAEEYEMFGNWLLDSTIFCAEVVNPDGLIDRLANEFVKEIK